jgi:hypothetical protein
MVDPHIHEAAHLQPVRMQGMDPVGAAALVNPAV